MSKLGELLGNFLFPQAFTCDICGIETFESNLCPACSETVVFNNESVCPVCGRKTKFPIICLECKGNAPVFKKAVSPLVYEGGSVILIAKFKNGNGYLKEYFADLIAEKVKDLPRIDCIVFVPMTEKAVRKRGYNQSGLLALCLSKRLNIPVVKNAIVKNKDTKEQKHLNRKERENNLKGCFKIGNRIEIKNKNILLVDDVLTTGATSDAVCKVLLSSGAANIFLATVASVEYTTEI